MARENSHPEERREHRRYQLQIPVLFKWLDGEKRSGAGFTRDVSPKGLFVLSSDLPMIKKHLNLRILLPAGEKQVGNVLRGEGKVIRVPSDGESQGFAIKARLFSWSPRRKSEPSKTVH